MSTKNNNATVRSLHPDLIIEQYSQYYQMVRHHTSLSWHIPSFTIAFSIVFLGLDSSKLHNWLYCPILPAICFFVICLFLVVMFVHHKRNGLYAKRFDQALVEIEKNCGYVTKVNVHHCGSELRKSFINKISSSLCLTIFLLLLIFLSFFISLYYFYLVLK